MLAQYMLKYTHAYTHREQEMKKTNIYTQHVHVNSFLYSFVLVIVYFFIFNFYILTTLVCVCVVKSMIDNNSDFF